MSFIGTIRDRLREYELFHRRGAVFLDRAPSLSGSSGAGSFGGCNPSLPEPDRETAVDAAPPLSESSGAGSFGGRNPSLPEPNQDTAVDAAPPPAGNLIFRDRNKAAFLPHSYGTPLDSRPDGKIVVFGLPKAGNVWLVSLLCDYTGLPPVHPIEDVDRPGVGMCHLTYESFMADRADFLHAVYLVRDIRDIIVSYYHNGQTQWFKDDLPNFHYETIAEFYFEWFLPRVVTVHQIHTHADAYLSFGVPVIRYERLCEEPERELGRLIKRLGLPYDEERIGQAVANNRIDKLRAEGRMLDRMVPPSHFRKGGHGSYRTELPDPVLQHATSEFGELIRKWGYPDANSASALSLREIGTTRTPAAGAGAT